MVPRSIVQNLAGLRLRERLLTFVWGLACWLSIALILLLVCGLVDWLIDRDRDTPMGVRVTLVVVQVGAWGIAGVWFILWPQLRRMPDETLALWVEAQVPRFDHRLISAVQFNQPGADLVGMSQELVGVVTREAEREAQQHGFARTADHSRLRWSAGLVGPILLVVALPFLIFPNVSFTLLARQALLDIEIPRSVHLESFSPEVWPIGESIPIFYRVTGKYNQDMVGSVYVTPVGQSTDRYPLGFMKEDEKGAIFKAEVPGASTDLRYSARLADGRTRAPSDMRLVPRPVITDNQAWIILPAYCGKRPDGGRYERQQVRGDVVGIPGSGVRVQFEVHRPIKEAWLELKAVDRAAAKPDDETPLREISKGTVAMRITRKVDPATGTPIDVWQADGTFDLTDDLTAYYMGVEDDDKFQNAPQPRRALRLMPEEPPQVVLLKDTFDLSEGSTFDLEGLPVVLGRQIRVPYRADGAYGLSRARLLYRYLKKHESGSGEPAQEEEWTKLELPEEKHPGPPYLSFDPKSGVFAGMKFDQQVSFFAAPSVNPDTILGRTMGGGRYFLETKKDALIDSKGRPIKLKSGDQIEYCVEVFASEREPKSSIPFARSETRVATMMSDTEFQAWLALVGREDERVRKLQEEQKRIFERK